LAIALEKITFFHQGTLDWLKDDAVVPHSSCRAQKTCSRQKMVINHMTTWRAEGKHDASYAVLPWDQGWSGRLCDVCEKTAKVYAEAGRQKCWEFLPTFFGLPEWKDLPKDLE
jgi:hypothetical protein